MIAFLVCVSSSAQAAAGASAGAGASSGKPPAAALSFAKATFAADGSDQALDLNDPSFWEKVLGPKPAQRLLSDVTQGKLDNATTDTLSVFLSGGLLQSDARLPNLTAMVDFGLVRGHVSTFVYVCVCVCCVWCVYVHVCACCAMNIHSSELRELVQDVLAQRRDGNVHTDADTITSILVELQVRGKNVKLPYAIDMPTKDGDHGDDGSGGDDAAGGASAGASPGAKARKRKARRKSGQKRGSEDELPTTLAEQAAEWMESLENTRRERKSVTQFNPHVRKGGRAGGAWCDVVGDAVGSFACLVVLCTDGDL